MYVTCKDCGLADIEVIRRCNHCLKVICEHDWNAYVHCNQSEDDEFVYCDGCSKDITVSVCDRH